MEEFSLLEAELSGENWQVGFSKLEKQSLTVPTQHQSEMYSETISDHTVSTHLVEQKDIHLHPQKELGIPVECPIMGIFYSSSSPNAPDYMHPGEHVEEGQVVGLVEAMKVFNEIVAPTAGIATEYKFKHGELVHQGDILLYLLPDADSSNS